MRSQLNRQSGQPVWTGNTSQDMGSSPIDLIKYAPVGQLKDHFATNEAVAGLSPVRSANIALQLNGRTGDFDTSDVGSTPARASRIRQGTEIGYNGAVLKTDVSNDMWVRVPPLSPGILVQCNGNTSDSDSEVRGSSPCTSAKCSYSVTE